MDADDAEHSGTDVRAEPEEIQGRNERHSRWKFKAGVVKTEAFLAWQAGYAGQTGSGRECVLAWMKIALMTGS